MKAIANRLTQVARMAALAFAVLAVGSAWAATTKGYEDFGDVAGVVLYRATQSTFHNSTVINVAANGTLGTAYAMDAGNNNTTSWKRFASNQGASCYTSPGTVLVYDEAGSYTVESDAQFGPMSFGGIWVKSLAANDAVFAIKGSGDRTTEFGAADKTTLFKFDKSFKINRQGTFSFLGTVNLAVAQGAVFTINPSYPAQSIVVPAGSTLAPSGAGTITLNTAGLTVNGTLDLTASTLPTISGNVRFASGSSLVLPEGTATGEVISVPVCSGTLTADGVVSVKIGTADPINAALTISGGAITQIDEAVVAQTFSSDYPSVVPAGYVYTYTASEAVTMPSLTVNGTLKLEGDFTVTDMKVAASGALEVVSGNTTVGGAATKQLSGNITVRSGATLTNTLTDSLNYSGSMTVDIYGTLAMGATRWSIPDGCTFKVHGRATVTGTGDSYGVLDFLAANDRGLDVYAASSASSVTIEGAVRVRNNNTRIWVASGTTLVLQSGIVEKNQQPGSFKQTGPGTLQLDAAMTLTGTSIMTQGTLRLNNTTRAFPLALQGSAALEIVATDAATTVPVNVTSINGNGVTLTGSGKANGTITKDAAPSGDLASFLQSSAWEGTFVADWAGAKDTRFDINSYGNANSTVRVTKLVGGYVSGSNANVTVVPTVEVRGFMTLDNGYSQKITTLTKLTGSGVFTNKTYSVDVTTLDNFTGTLATLIDAQYVGMRIGTINLSSAPAPGDKIVNITSDSNIGNIANTKVSVNGVVDDTIALEVKSDGIYVVVPTVTITVPEVANATATVTVGGVKQSGVAGEGETVYTFDYGTAVTVTYTPDTYYSITAGDAEQVITITANTSAVAPTVTRNTVTVTVPAVDNATVSVAYTTGGVSQTGTAADTYTVDQGTAVIVTYTAGEGYLFGNATSKVVDLGTVTANIEVTAQDTGSTAAAGAKIGDSNYKPTFADAVTDASNGDTVTLLAASDDNVTLSDKTIVFVENGFAFDGTLSGNGTIKVSAAPSYTTWSASRFSTEENAKWTGTFVIDWNTTTTYSNGRPTTTLNFNQYGIDGSTVRLDKDWECYFPANSTSDRNTTINPKIVLNATLKHGNGSTNKDYVWTPVIKFMSVSSTEGGVLDLNFQPGDGTAYANYEIVSLEDFKGKIKLSAARDRLVIDAVVTTGMPEANTVIVPIEVTGSNCGVFNALNSDARATVNPISVTANVERENTIIPHDAKAVYTTINDVSGLYYTVANIGDKYYATYAAAVADYTAGDTIVVSDATAGNVPTGWELTSEGTRLTKIQYTVTWSVDGASTDEIYYYGATPTHADPTKAATAQYTYTFTGWDDGTTQYGPTDALPAVTGDVTYTATYSETVNTYTLTWKNDDGSTIDTTVVAYGDTPTHADATKAPTTQYTYTFTGWTPEVVAVTGAAEYTATYSSTVNNYKVTIPTVEHASTVVVTVGDDVIPLADGGYTVPYGSTVTITYTADEGYFFGTSKTKVVEIASVEGDTAVPAEQDGSTTAAVAQDSDGTYYADVMTGLYWLLTPANLESGYLQLLGETTGTNVYGAYDIGYDAASKRYAKAVALIDLEGNNDPGYLTVQAALDAAENGALVRIKANNSEALTLANGNSVTINAKKGDVIYDYNAPVAAGDYMVDAGETVEGVTTYTARDWYTWTLELDTHPNATVTGLPAAVSEGDAVADRTVSFTVAADATYKITAVKVDGVAQVGDNGTYTYTVSGDAIVTVETELDVKTFTVVVPENTTVTVTGATANGDGSYTATIGDTVTITYAAAGAYVAGGTQSQNITVGADTESIAAPTDYTTTAAVAQIGDNYYPSLAAAVTDAEADDTIVLLADDRVSLTDGLELTINKSLTITGAVDTNGEPLYTIYGKNTVTGTNDIFITGSGTVTLSNVKIAQFGNNAATDPAHAPVYVSTSFTGTVNLDNVYISEFNRGGLFLYGGTFNVTDCYIDCAQSRSGAFTKGIEIKGTATGTIADTVIVNMERSSTTYSVAGIEIYGSGSVVVDGCTIVSDGVDHESVKATYGIVSSRVGVHDPSGGHLIVTNCYIDVSNAALSVSDGEYGPVNAYTIVVDGEDTYFGNYIATWSAGSSITINNGEFNKDVYADAGSIIITGGTFSNFALDTDTGSIAISGGLFDRAVSPAFCAEGYIPTTVVVDDETYYTVKQGAYVAEINGQGYETLAEAFAAVTDATQTTIEVLEDCEGGGIVVPSGRNITVNFNGCTYTVNSEPLAGSTGTQNQCFQLLKDSTIVFKDGAIVADNANVKMLIQNYANLTLDGMELDGTEGTNALQYVLSTNNGSTTIDDTTITAPEGVIAFDVCTGWGGYTSNAVTVTGESVITGDVEVSFYGAGTAPSLALSSGTLTGNIVMAQRAGEATITKDPSFEVDAPADYEWDSTGKLVAKNYVAQVGEQKFETLAEAVSATQTGTITLLKDCSGGGIVVPSGKNITIDFKGFTYTVDSTPLAGSTGTQNQCFQLLKGSTIVFKDGAIVADNAAVKMLIQNYANLTLDGMTLDGTQGTNALQYVLSTNNGLTLIKDTAITAKAGCMAFDVCTGWGGYTSNSVAVDGNSVITGNIEVSFYGEGTAPSLALSSGTLDGNIVMAQRAGEATITKDPSFEVAAPADYEWDSTGKLVAKTYVAQVGSAKFESPEAAFAAAGDGDTITLLGNCSGNGIIVPQGKFDGTGLTVDFAGFTYTVTGPELAGSSGTKTQAFQLLKGNNITFANGTITSSLEAGAKMLVQNYSNLTLDNMVLDGTNLDDVNPCYVLSTNNGSTEIKDTTINAKEGDIAFDACSGWGGYLSNSVEVTGTSEINGNVEVSYYGQTGTEPAALTLTSGTLNGEIIMEQGADEATVTKAATFEAEAPADYEWDPTGKLVAKTYVAQVGSAKYETLADAVAAANAATGAVTIKLLSDLDFSEEAYAGYKWAGSTYNPLTIARSNVTLDLGGHTISNMGNTAIVFGNLLAKDGRIANCAIRNGTLVAGTTGGVVNSYVLGIAGVDGMTVEGITTLGGINVYTASTGVVIDGCTVQGTKYYTVCAQCGSEVTIRGTTYTKNTDSTVANKSMFWIQGAGSDSDLVTTGNPTGAFGTSIISIEGGDFTVDTTNGGVFYLASGVTPTVSGGTFNIPVPANCCAAGYIPTYDEVSGKYGVTNAYVAKIGDTPYETLVDAVSAANAATGAVTIELLTDLDFSDEAYAGYKWAGATYNPLTITNDGVTIDLGGHTISNMGNCALVFGHLLAKDGRIANCTIKNGTLRAGTTGDVRNSYVLGIAGVDGMTIKDVTTLGGINVYTASTGVVIDGCTVQGTKYYTVCAQCGSQVTIRGTTYTKNTDSTVANKSMFWIQGAGSDSDLVTTGNTTGAFGTSIISIEGGDFTVDTANGGAFYLASGVTPTVSGGTFNIPVPANCCAVGFEPAGEEAPYTVKVKETAAVVTTEVEPGNVVTNAVLELTAAAAEAIIADSGKTLAEALVAEDSNGLKKWENYVLDIDTTEPEDVKAPAVQAAASDTKEEAKLNLSFTPKSTATTGIKVSYKLDTVTVDNGVATTTRSDVATATPVVPLGDLEAGKTKYVTVRAVLTSSTGTETEVEVQKVVGVMAVNSTQQNTIVAVPWESFNGTSITANELVYTGNRTAGDTLTVYVPSTGKYKTWTLVDGAWGEVQTYSLDANGNKANDSAGDPADQLIPRGAGVWVYRQNVDEKIYLLGQKPEAETATVTVEKGYNLVAPVVTDSSQTTIAVNEVVPVAEEKVDATANDKVLIPVAGKAPYNLYYNADEKAWGYDLITVDGFTVTKTFVKEVSIPTGTGFWYISGANGNKDITIGTESTTQE